MPGQRQHEAGDTLKLSLESVDVGAGMRLVMSTNNVATYNVVLPTGNLGQGKHIMHGMVYHMVPKPSSIIFPCFECPVENTICRLFPIKTLLVSRCGNPPLICHSYRLSGDQGKYAKNED